MCVLTLLTLSEKRKNTGPKKYRHDRRRRTNTRAQVTRVVVPRVRGFSRREGCRGDGPAGQSEARGPSANHSSNRVVRPFSVPTARRSERTDPSRRRDAAAFAQSVPVAAGPSGPIDDGKRDVFLERKEQSRSGGSRSKRGNVFTPRSGPNIVLPFCS